MGMTLPHPCLQVIGGSGAPPLWTPLADLVDLQEPEHGPQVQGLVKDSGGRGLVARVGGFPGMNHLMRSVH